MNGIAKAQFGWWTSSDSTHIFNRNPGAVIVGGYQPLGKLTIGSDKDLYNLALVGDYNNLAQNFLKIGVMGQNVNQYRGHTIFDLYHNNSEAKFAGYNFRINGLSRFFINGNGHVGIGTELPKALLDLNGGPDWNGFRKTIRLGESQALAFESGGNEYGFVPTGGGISLVTSNGNSGGFGVSFSKLMSINKNKIVFDGDVEFRGNVIGGGFSGGSGDGGGNGDSGGGKKKYLLSLPLGGSGADGAWLYASNGIDIYYNAGKVGIATTNPAYTLDVGGTINAQNILINGSAISGGSQWTTSGSNIYNNNTGNTGIGLANPGAKFTIRQGATDPGTYDDGKTLFVSGNMNAGTNYDGGIEFRQDNLSQGIGFGYASMYATGTSANQQLNIYSKGTSPLTLNAFGGGSVGIGISNPDPNYKLSVNGKVKAQELYLTTTVWPDNVFENTYKLMPLKELEKSIQKEKHLPGIPSEKEVIENGVGIADMQAKLLQKIEELTLYIIEQNKRIEKLEERNKELTNRNSAEGNHN